MANPEHLKILNQGVEAWNEWREENPEARPDLTKTDLTGADLIRADLFKADLSGAELSNVDLIEADLRGADLTGANLTEANLTGARLLEADLTEANLTGANLLGADLRWANLRGANLVQADLRWMNLLGADLNMAELTASMLLETIFGDTVLKDCIGLDECLFSGPCTIDFRTLVVNPDLPLKFLRGCGLPDDLIEYLPSLLRRKGASQAIHTRTRTL